MIVVDCMRRAHKSNSLVARESGMGGIELSIEFKGVWQLNTFTSDKMLNGSTARGERSYHM